MNDDELESPPKGLTEANRVTGLTISRHAVEEEIALALVNKDNVVKAWIVMSVENVEDFAKDLQRLCREGSHGKH